MIDRNAPDHEERLVRVLQMVANDVPHGPRGECPEPELCSALIDRDGRVHDAALDEVAALALPDPVGDGWDGEVRMTKRTLHQLLNRSLLTAVAKVREAAPDAD